ncbi:hypothetical protein HZH66_005035 [Vespula vulgaris]|uniref:Uncharacterized protein n=1 Tax=Vespula vulgaris TaxID=7454 RepID=A0A834NCU4_VESVU|nr:hypothetical protein HZH66_005035 [Vespula vulgaris]
MDITGKGGGPGMLQSKRESEQLDENARFKYNVPSRENYFRDNRLTALGHPLYKFLGFLEDRYFSNGVSIQ